MTRLLSKKFFMFGTIVGFYYIIQFVMCVGCCNFYSVLDIAVLNEKADASKVGKKGYQSNISKHIDGGAVP